MRILRIPRGAMAMHSGIQHEELEKSLLTPPKPILLCQIQNTREDPHLQAARRCGEGSTSPFYSQLKTALQAGQGSGRSSSSAAGFIALEQGSRRELCLPAGSYCIPCCSSTDSQPVSSHTSYQLAKAEVGCGKGHVWPSPTV